MMVGAHPLPGSLKMFAEDVGELGTKPAGSVVHRRSTVRAIYCAHRGGGGKEARQGQCHGTFAQNIFVLKVLTQQNARCSPSTSQPGYMRAMLFASGVALAPTTFPSAHAMMKHRTDEQMGLIFAIGANIFEGCASSSW